MYIVEKPQQFCSFSFRPTVSSESLMHSHKHLLCLLFPGAFLVLVVTMINPAVTLLIKTALDWIVKARQSKREALYAIPFPNLFLVSCSLSLAQKQMTIFLSWSTYKLELAAVSSSGSSRTSSSKSLTFTCFTTSRSSDSLEGCVWCTPIINRHNSSELFLLQYFWKSNLLSVYSTAECWF